MMQCEVARRKKGKLVLKGVFLFLAVCGLSAASRAVLCCAVLYGWLLLIMMFLLLLRGWFLGAQCRSL